MKTNEVSASIKQIKLATLAVTLSLTIFAGSNLPALAVPTETLSIGDAQIALSEADIGLTPDSGSVGASSTGVFQASSGVGVFFSNLNGLSPGAVSVFDFPSVSSLPNAEFKLTNINPGLFGSAPCAAPPAVGQGCTPSGSPFNLVNTGAGTTVSFSASGTVTNSLTGQMSAFTATFATEFAGQTYQDVLTKLASGGIDTSSFSASINIPSAAFASTLAIGNPTLTISANSVAFSPLVLTGPSTGIFSPISFTGARITSIGTGAAPVVDFVTLQLIPNLTFDFENFDSGDFSAAACANAPAVGQTCTPAGSEFDLMNVQTGSVLSMSFDALLVNSLTGVESPLAGVLTTEFPVSYQDFLAGLSNGDEYSASYSLQFATPETSGSTNPVDVPEPSSTAILAAGVLGLCFMRRNRTRRAATVPQS